jgi:2-(1,2-epoxy-1,2-dihydrophenyl)acetyl-CoA isomerase
MAYEFVILETDDHGIATLTLNRPDRLNAAGNAMMMEILAAIREVSSSGARAFVLTGAGRGFCAGQDLKDSPAQVSAAGGKGWVPATGDESFITAMRRLPQPAIAAVNGPAAGMGMSMALACDLRIVSDQGYFAAAWAPRGIPPEALACYTLPQVVGLPKAMEIIFMGKTVRADEALQIGLANEVVPHERLMQRTQEVALAIAKGPPVAHAMSKRAMYMGLHSDIESFAQFESFGIRLAMETQDRQEGIQSFLERREPVFKGE